MHELHLTTDAPPTLEPLEVAPRSLSAAELTDDLGRTARDDAFLGRAVGRTGAVGQGGTGAAGVDSRPGSDDDPREQSA
jgi:DNA recombination protein RmuC